MSRHVPHKNIRLRVAIQIVAAVVVTACVLLWSLGHYRRYDFSRSHKFEVSNQTRQILWSLTSPGRVIVYFSPSSISTGSELHEDIMALLREYQFLAHGRRDLTIEKVDPLRNPARARDLQAQYRFAGNENVLIVEYGGRSTVIPVPEMGEYDTTPTQYGDRPRLVAFRGEQVLTSAFIGLVNPASNRKVYFLQGHGEGLPGVPPMQIIGQNLKRQNITTSPLNLSSNPTIPTDASLVVIAGAHFDPSPDELTALRTYWRGGGHLLVLLDPTGDTPGLDSFLAEEGKIRPRNDRVLRLLKLGAAVGILRDVTGEFFAGSEITARLVGLNVLFAGNTRSLAINGQLNASFKEGDQTKTRPLIRAIHGFRGCSDFANADGKGVNFDPVKDNFFPVYIAAITDLGGVNDDRVALGASRMVVVGSSDFLKDKFLAGTALDFLSSAINTLIDRTQLAGTTPKTKEFFTLNLDDLQLQFLAIWSMGAVPLAAAILGILFLWRRRS
jgi:ABC-2 type transport system permease protein